MMTTDI